MYRALPRGRVFKISKVINMLCYVMSRHCKGPWSVKSSSRLETPTMSLIPQYESITQNNPRCVQAVLRYGHQ